MTPAAASAGRPEALLPTAEIHAPRPFEPARSGLACRDGRRFEMVVFATGAPLAVALHALMVQAEASWLRATPDEMVALLARWHDLAPARWPESAEAMLDALLSRAGRYARDLARFGLTVTRDRAERGVVVDVRRGPRVSRPRRRPGRRVR